jgi:hypothetical protein
MRERKIVLINTSQRQLGETSSAVFGRFFVAQIFAAALERGTQDDRQLSLLFIDEAHEYLDKKTEKLLDQARKFGLGLVVATQRLEKIEADVKSAINSNTAIKMAGPVSYADAQALAREIYCAGEFIRSMKKEDNRYAEFAAYVRNMTPRAIRITMPFGIRTSTSTPSMRRAASEPDRHRPRRRGRRCRLSRRLGRRQLHVRCKPRPHALGSDALWRRRRTCRRHERALALLSLVVFGGCTKSDGRRHHLPLGTVPDLLHDIGARLRRAE